MPPVLLPRTTVTIAAMISPITITGVSTPHRNHIDVLLGTSNDYEKLWTFIPLLGFPGPI
jgi:hypothetical protein